MVGNMLLRLATWAALSQAFYIWHPCEDTKSCGPDKRTIPPPPRIQDGAERRSADVGADGVTFVLHRKAAAQPDARVAALRLRNKYSSRREKARGVTDGRSLQERGKNAYSVMTAAAPTLPNSVGINQDGTDFSYFIRATFGDKGKPLYLLLDTGAGTSWVMGSNCKTEACQLHDSLGTADSGTLKALDQSFRIDYGSGSVMGSLATDTVNVAGMQLQYTFGVANDTSRDFAHFPFDGILGMAMSAGSTDNFMDTVRKAKVLPSNSFAVSLNRGADGPNDGELVFGRTNPARFSGDIAYNPIVNAPDSKGAWSIALGDVAVYGKKAGLPAGRLAYIDTGTSFIFGPPDDVALLHKLIPGSSTKDGATWTVPCDTRMPVTVTFGARDFDISSRDWIVKNSGGDCTSNIHGHEVVKGSWLFGDVFLKNVYAVFDVDQSAIGFANRPVSTTGAASATTATGTTVTPGSMTGAPTLGIGTSVPVSAGGQTNGAVQTSVAQGAANSAAGGVYVSVVCVMAVLAAVA